MALAQDTHANGSGVNVTDILSSVEAAKDATRAALQITHPDKGGDRALFTGVQQCRAILSEHHGTEI